MPDDSTGVDPARLEILLRRVRYETESGHLPSVQVAVARRGVLVAFETFGDAECEAAVPRYILQSAGRPFVASAAWKLLGDGLLQLDEPIAEIIPEFAANGKQAVTVKDALTHRGGFPYAPLGYPKMLERETRVAAFAKWRLDEPPGQTFQYHLTSVAWLIDEIVWRRAESTLPDFLAREISGPLNLSFGLGVSTDEQRATVAPMRCTDGDGSHVDPWGPWYLNNPDIVAAGEPSHSVVATASDIALHYQALLAALDGDERIWKQRAVVEAVRPHVVAVPAGEQIYGGSETPTAMGLFITVLGENRTPNLPAIASPQTFGNGGAAYQAGFADPATGVSFAMITNGYPMSGYDYTQRGIAMMTNINNLAADLT